MSEEGEFTKEREEIPPVLPVSSSSTSGAAKGGADPAPIVTTVGDAGASLTERLDTWQASNLPEEKTYFSCDVSIKEFYLDFLTFNSDAYMKCTRHACSQNLIIITAY